MNKTIIMKALYIGFIFNMFIIVVSAFNLEIISTNPAPIQAGEYADITFRIDTFSSSSDRSEFRDIELYIKENDFIMPFPGQEIKIARLQAGQSLTRTMRVYFSENIPTGFIPLTLSLKSQGLFQEKTENIFVSSKIKDPELYIGKINSKPQNILQDTKSNFISVSLQNFGDKKAELLIVDLVPLIDGIITESYTNSMRDTKASIGNGMEENFEFTFNINKTKLTSIPFNLNIQYRVKNNIDNTYNTNFKTIPFNLSLSKTPWFEILKFEQLEKFQAGNDNNQLKIHIKNIGYEDGRTVRLRLFPDPSDPFDFESTSIFVSSNIKVGENTSFLIPLDIIDTALLQTYTINAQFESLVGSNRYIQTERIKISVEEKASSGKNLYLYTLIALSLLIALLIGIFHNKKNNFHSNKENNLTKENKNKKN